mmetsp:Transcript_27666/g.77353  ORF Transcript_27666/g.77353 Transcript_27666/m.77353 type:complete len:346 (-) Transcript_27666:9-1046(-)
MPATGNTGDAGSAQTLVLKAMVLVALMVQSSSYVLMRHYVQVELPVKVPSSALLLVGEFMKLFIATAVVGSTALLSDEGRRDPLSTLANRAEEICRGGSVMIIPAGIYMTMNILSFVALEYISSAMFITVAQSKIFMTAICTVIFLGRKLSLLQWGALTCLVCGNVLVSYQEMQMSDDKKNETSTWWNHALFLTGTAAVTIEVMLSGFVSVYYEKILKTSKASVWERNMQLGFLSALFYYGVHYYYTSNLALTFVAEWTFPVWVTCFLGAFGGILVALVLRYSDAILKCLATSLSIVVVIISSNWLFGSQLTMLTILGAVLVISGIVVYSNHNYFERRLFDVNEK